MAIQKPGIPKGTRDFGPTETARRNYIFDNIRSVFRQHGYIQIETPAMENLDTLLGKYGEEGDKLLFKILNSGDFLNGVDKDTFEGERNTLSLKICEKGLRYDLTVPFARFVVQHQHEIEFPFKRFQIQPVWRADRPQKGRYREFTQCDADVIGSNTLLNEADLLTIIDDVFFRLGLHVKIKLNNRKVLAGIAEYIGQPDKITDITVAIDKLEKIGLEAVNEELLRKGVSVAGIDKLEPLFNLHGSSEDKLTSLEQILGQIPVALQGIEETRSLLKLVSATALSAEIEFDISLARGLNYYTGSIIEVKSLDVQIGSICGGGRYDDLTGIFGLKNISGVGISFGADRIYDVLDQLNLFPSGATLSSSVMLANFGEREALYCLRVLTLFHKAGIAAELYPDAVKLGKQFAYADAKKIPFVAIIGETEMAEGKLTLKDLKSGEQQVLTIEEAVGVLGKGIYS